MPELRRTVLLDANLLLLLVIGTMDIPLISAFKRTASFTAQDFRSLEAIVSKADAVLTTPHVLTEVSNLANSLRDDQKITFANYFRTVIMVIEERFTEAGLLSQHSLFRFGIADVSMLQAGATLILTEDGRLASQVNQQGFSVALDLKSAVALQAVL